MDFNEIIKSRREATREFSKIEQRPWTPPVIMTEMMKQVGELANLVMVKENYYFAGRDKLEGGKYKKVTDAALGDEMIDIITQVVRLADYYKIDLDRAFRKVRAEERRHAQLVRLASKFKKTPRAVYAKKTVKKIKNE
jgi:NTP pyrophosphatase (non-canonical NTP hydrolase)